MYKAFAAVLLAAIASAQDAPEDRDSEYNEQYFNGTSRDKAVTHSMGVTQAPDEEYSDQISVGVMNFRPAEGAAGQVHIDLEWVNGDSGNWFYPYKEMGFCFRKENAAGNWDCVRSRHYTNTSELEENELWEQAYDIVDGYSADGQPQNFVADDDADNQDPAMNWARVGAESQMSDCRTSDSRPGMVNCMAQTVYIYRDMQTSQAEQDVQFSNDDRLAWFEAYAWIRDEETSWDNWDATDAAAYFVGPKTWMQFITPRWTDNDDTFWVKAYEPNVELPERVIAASGSASESDDGATAMTTFAATLMATVYALAF